jgi:hypothetical protein
MTLDFHALWMLTGVGTVVFAALAAPTWTAHAAAAVAFALASAAGLWFGAPPADAAGVLIAGAAVILLLRPGTAGVAPFAGGALAGVWGSMLAAQDVPVGVAVPAAAVWPIAAAWCARRPGFLSRRMRDEALLLLTVLGVITAVLPGVQDGWRAAVNLSLQSPPAAALPLPAWTVGVGASALLLGALFSLWSRR